MGKPEMSEKKYMSSAGEDEANLSLLTEEVVTEELLWEGETWPFACFSPLTCTPIKWKITNKKIVKSFGFVGGKMEVIDLRRVTDIAYYRSCTQICSGRGSIVIHSTTSLDPVVIISTWGLKNVYRKLKEAWLSSNANQFIMAS